MSTAPEIYEDGVPPLDLAPGPKSGHSLSDKVMQTAVFCVRWGIRGLGISVFSYAGLNSFGKVEDRVGPATVEAQLSLNGDGDVRANASLGGATFDYSDGPLGMDLRITGINKDASSTFKQSLDKTITKNSQTPAALKQIERAGHDTLDHALWKGGLVLLASALSGSTAAEGSLLIARSLRKKEAITSRGLKRGAAVATAGALSLSAAGFATSAISRDESSLKHPKFNNSDSLKTVVSLAETTIRSFDNYKQDSSRLEVWLGNYIQLLKNLNTLPVFTNKLVPVVVIADRHSRPCTYERVDEIVRAFHAKFVMNAGDETEWGQAFEQKLFNGNCPSDNPGIVSVPIFFVGGNHDSKQTAIAMSKYKNVTVLDGQTVPIGVQFGGQQVSFKIFGEPDPRFTPDITDRPSNEEEDAMVTAQAQEIADKVNHDKPDIVLVHAPFSARQIRKDVTSMRSAATPLIVTGHSHKYALDRKNQILTSGSIGASGLRGYDGGSSDVSAAAIAYFDPATKKLVAVLNLGLKTDGTFESQMEYVDQNGGQQANSLENLAG